MAPPIAARAPPAAGIPNGVMPALAAVAAGLPELAALSDEVRAPSPVAERGAELVDAGEDRRKAHQ
jgi:hypothetical protein